VKEEIVPLRSTLLIVVASERPGLADDVAARLKHDGSVAYPAHSAAGCLRVATSIGPDIVLLDPALPRGLERKLKAHPVSARAQVLHLTDATVPAKPDPSTHLVAA
jgi:hypothetical protein